MKLMIGIPVLDNVSWPFFLHTSALIGKLARKFELELCFVNRTAIDRAREITVTEAIHRDCDYLLFIDDDTIAPIGAVEKLLLLLEPEKAVSASGFCFQRGYKYLPMVYRYKNLEWGKGDCQLINPFPAEPFQVNATGMGICLLKVSLLKELEDKLGDCFGRDGNETEDFYFYSKAYKMGFTSWVDPSLEATHIGNPLFINSGNVDDLRTRDHKSLYFIPEASGGRSQKGVCEV